MGKVKCKRAIRRIQNVVTMIANEKLLISPSILQKEARKGLIKTGMNAIDREMYDQLKTQKYGNRKIKRIMCKTKFTLRNIA